MVMAELTSSLVLIICVISTTTATLGQQNTPKSWGIPARGHHTFAHTLTQAVFRAQQLQSAEHADMTALARDVLADLSIFQTELLVQRSEEILKAINHVGVTEGVMAATNSTCANDTTRMIISWLNKKERWSLQFLDAAGKPGPGLSLFHVNFIGNYKQCRDAQAPSNASVRGFKGNYCTLNASPHGIQVPIGIKLGSCMPDSCSESELTRLTAEIVKKLTNDSLLAGHAECHTDEREMTTATVVAITFLSVILALVLLGTLVDILLVQRPKWVKEANESSLLTNSGRASSTYGAVGSDDLLHGQNGVDETSLLLLKPIPTPGFYGKILITFSIYTNATKLLNTSQPAGSLGAIHGIRFFSMTWVMLCHTFAFGAFSFENLDMFPTLLKRWTFAVIANGFFSVDTFFTLSGLLTAYLTYQQMKKFGWKINWALYYFHRFWRLTPPYMLILLMVLGFQQYLGSGAVWETIQPLDRDNCNSNWWANLLYVNNLISVEKMCFGHSWYLSNDMQFFLLSPLLIIPFYFKLVYGLAACLIFLLITFITTGVLSAQNEWSVSMVTDKSMEIIGTWFEDYYIKPWCRIGPYVVGIFTGVILAHYPRIYLPKYAVAIGWTLSAIIGLACVYGIYGDLSGDSPSSVGVAALYNSVSRAAWGVCICWVILACAHGYGGFVNSLLSWSPFVVLGRLTYAAYLIHPSLFYAYYQNMESMYYLTDTSIAVTFCGLLVCTYLVSFVLVLLFESPMIGLERIIFKRKRKD